MGILKALIKKEFFQIIRDPSTIIVAFILPAVILLIYMYGINLDTLRVTIGIKNDEVNPAINELVKSFGNSKFVKSYVYDNKEMMYSDLIGERLRSIIIIPNDFSDRLSRSQEAQLLLITDGSEVNIANYAIGYTAVIVNEWLAKSKYAHLAVPQPVDGEIRYWFNQEINSRHFILPGSLAITMTLIGVLLTALVIAREWERGTMEALLTTQVRKIDILAAKYISYFILGMISMAFNVFMCIAIFGVPFRGNFLILFCVSGLFLMTCLGTGLLISTSFKDQFLASEVALTVGFMPGLMLSGLIFPIYSMPKIFQWLTRFIPPRYFVTFVESEFLAGSIPEIIITSSIFLSLLAILLFVLVYRKTVMRLD